jgi:hypothetical protein
MPPLLLIIFMFFFRHPMHLGVTEIIHNQTANSLEISHKLFYDDLEDAIEKSQKVKLNLNTAKQHSQTETHLQQYFATSFVVFCNGQQQQLNYVGYEYEEDAIWVHYEVSSIAKRGNLLITNRNIMNLYDDQNNFLHFQQGTKRQSLRYNFENQTQELTY